MSKDTGWVFWGSNNQYTGPTSTNSSTYAANVYGSYYYGANSYGGPGPDRLQRGHGRHGRAAGSCGAQRGRGHGDVAPTSGLNYMEVARDGSKILCNWTPSSAYLYMNQEQINYVTNIDFSELAAMHAGFNRANDSGRLESSNGRASEAMAISLPSETVYYAYKAGAGNETAMEMVSGQVERRDQEVRQDGAHQQHGSTPRALRHAVDPNAPSA